MKDGDKSKEQLINELAEMRRRIAELEALETEYRRAEGALRESEAKYRTLIEQLPAATYIAALDKVSSTLYQSPQIEQIVGFTAEEWTSDPDRWAEQLHPDDRQRVLAQLADSHATGEPFRSEYRLIARDGREVWVRDEATIVRDETGKPLVLQGVLFDITERQRAEAEIRRLNENLERRVIERTAQLETANQELEEEVAERKRAEDALRESHERLVTILDSIDADIYVADIGTYEILFMNQHMRHSFGKDLVGKVCWKVFRNESGPCAHCTNDKLLDADGSPTGAVVWEGQNPITGRWYINYDRAIKWVDGRLVRLQVATDITARQRAEEEIRKLSQFQERIIDTAGVWLDVLDEKANVVIWNKAAEEISGYSREEVVGHDKIWEWLYPDEEYRSQVLGEAFAIIEEGGEEKEGETSIRCKDGQIKAISWNSQSLVDEKGNPIGSIALGRDITGRKRAERLLQALNVAALAMQRALTPEEIFTAVAEGLKRLGFLCSLFLTDESQSRLSPTYLSYDARALKVAERLTGLKRRDFSIPVETIDIYEEVVWEKKTVLIENLEEVTRRWLPGPFKRFAGRIMRMLKILKSIVAPLIVEDQVIGVLSVQSADLTEDDVPAITAFAHQMAAAWRKAQLMQDLQNSLEELKRIQAQLLQAQKMEAIGQLAGGICHDFNNLLTPISGFAELLLWKAAEGSEQQEYLRQIKVAAERAAALTRQLRLFTRQAAGERHPVQLNSVVEETYDLLGRSISKEIAIELSLSADLRVVEADPSQIGQVLMNLCLNACDAMPDGGTLTLETRNVTLDEEYAQQVLAAQPGHYVCLSVSDTGIGMSPQVQARLFEPFFTTKEVGKGTGLGLAVGYGIVKGHGGFIQVYSEVGRGSTFQVYLPAIESLVEERKAEGLELPTGTETILLVDDEETVRALAQRVLEPCGYTVLLAESGVQALEVYQAHRGEIALVVLDVVMPEMGGLECLRRLREMNPEVKVLISTGYTARSLARELMAEGALGVVEKPFQIQDFATAVWTTIDR